MNCCDNKNDKEEVQGQNQNQKNKGHMPHMLMMALCCGAPIILLLIIPLLGANFSGLRGILTVIAPFICPLMMIFMIPMMFRGHKKNDNGGSTGHCETVKATDNNRLE